MIAILDLDGVCGDYLPHLFRFLHKRTGIPEEDYQKVFDLDKVHRAAGLDRMAYNDLKAEYRLGYKWEMPPVAGMPAATHALQRQGYKVFVATTRALDCRERTRDWLRRHEFAFDDLSVVGTGTMGKYVRVGQELGIHKDEWKVIAFEDNFGAALAAGRMGWRPVVRNAVHNGWGDLLGTRRAFERQYSIRRYDSSAELIEIAAEFVEECAF